MSLVRVYSARGVRLKGGVLPRDGTGSAGHARARQGVDLGKFRIMCTCESYLAELISSRKKMRVPLAQKQPVKAEPPSTTLQTRRDEVSKNWAVRPACVHTSGAQAKKNPCARFESSAFPSAHQTCKGMEHLQRHGALCTRLIRGAIF